MKSIMSERTLLSLSALKVCDSVPVALESLSDRPNPNGSIDTRLLLLICAIAAGTRSKIRARRIADSVARSIVRVVAPAPSAPRLSAELLLLLLLVLALLPSRSKDQTDEACGNDDDDDDDDDDEEGAEYGILGW